MGWRFIYLIFLGLLGIHGRDGTLGYVVDVGVALGSVVMKSHARNTL